MKVAFFGTGNMGEPMALNLIRAGHQVTVYNRTTAKAAALAQAGAKVAKSAEEAARDSGIAITMLANDRAVRETVLGVGAPGSALIDGLPKGAIHMCTSTIGVTLSKELAETHASRGQGYVAAPVLGRPDAAAEKRLWVLAAGPADLVEKCRPLMEAMGRGISVMGEKQWQANVTKIASNFMIASVVETIGEAFALIRKSGMDAHVFLDLVNEFFKSPIYADYGRMIADRRFEPAGFRLALGLKDVGLALEAAQEAAAPLPIASVVRDHCLSAIAHGRADADWSVLTEEAARNAGLDSA